MDELAIILVAALAGGMLASLARLPPLVGFLAAGFLLNALGVRHFPELDVVADLGVTLLLFGIGLKVNVRTLVRREVWTTASAHLVVTAVVATSLLAGVGMTGIGLAGGEDWRTFAVLGLAISFSSTVLVVKLLEESSATESLGGRTAIGILIVQDLVAVGFLTLTAGEPPSPWAVLLLLLIPGAWVLRRLLGMLGHDELRPLFGVALALVPGYLLFDSVGVKGDLGALAVGMLLATHPGSDELAKSLFSIKDLLLVGFFLSIGFVGLPEWGHVPLVILLLLLLPLKAVLYALLLHANGLRRRTSVLAATSLTNHSEFGLIVAVAAAGDLLAEEWVVVLATTVATSFVLSAAISGHAEPMVRAARRLLAERPAERLHPEDRPIEVGHADAVVLGMGRVGRAAYERLTKAHGIRVVGIETVAERVEGLQAAGLDVVEGDATDPDFWARLQTGHVELAVLAMPFHGSNLATLERLGESGFGGTVAVVAQYDEDLEQARAYGAHTGFQLYDGAGSELADRAAQAAGLGRGG